MATIVSLIMAAVGKRGICMCLLETRLGTLGLQAFTKIFMVTRPLRLDHCFMDSSGKLESLLERNFGGISPIEQ
jgi:hypothetical protein